MHSNAMPENARRGFLRRMVAGAAWAGLAQFGSTACAFAASRLEAGAPSETALGAAKLRAVHQILEYPRILHDPFALRMLGPQEAHARYFQGRTDGFRTGSSHLVAALV